MARGHVELWDSSCTDMANPWWIFSFLRRKSHVRMVGHSYVPQTTKRIKGKNWMVECCTWSTCPFFHFCSPTHSHENAWIIHGSGDQQEQSCASSHSHGQPGITTPGNWSGIATSSRFVWMVKRCLRCHQTCGRWWDNGGMSNHKPTKWWGYDGDMMHEWLVGQTMGYPTFFRSLEPGFAS